MIASGAPESLLLTCPGSHPGRGSIAIRNMYIAIRNSFQAISENIFVRFMGSSRGQQICEDRAKPVSERRGTNIKIDRQPPLSTTRGTLLGKYAQLSIPAEACPWSF
jgi:hypothetical protein